MTSLFQRDVRTLFLPPKIVFWGCFFILLWIPFRINTFNYRPLDDANRHVAKVISGKDWPEILVMDSNYTALDHNEGWHWILQRVHDLGLDAEMMLLISSISLFLLFLLTGLFLFQQHPLCWMGALFLLPFIGPVHRLAYGRPLLISSSITLILLSLWYPEEPASPKRRWLFTVLLIGLAGWVHGAWYLFALLPFSILLSGRTRQAFHAGCCWLTGSVLAGVLNGSPVQFLYGQVRQTWVSVDSATVGRQLVSEFQPSLNFMALLVIFATAFIWKVTHKNLRGFFGMPAFWMALTCWILGLVNGRFWYDWGMIGLILLIATTFKDWDENSHPFPVPLNQNALLTGLAFTSVFILYTVDVKSRWSNADFLDPLKQEDPEHAGWLPESGGILYSDDMLIYYQTFFHNPHGDWKYILGHEPALMPQDDLTIYREIQFYGGQGSHLFQPWVEKMRPVDRLILYQPSEPSIEGLEWKKVAYNTWSGRLPRSEDNESSTPTPDTSAP